VFLFGFRYLFQHRHAIIHDHHSLAAGQRWDALTGGSLRYNDGSWKTGTNNGDGTFTVTTSAGSVTYEMTYAGAAQTKSNIPVSVDSVAFQTVDVAVKLLSSTSAPLDTEPSSITPPHG